MCLDSRLINKGHQTRKRVQDVIFEYGRAGQIAFDDVYEPKGFPLVTGKILVKKDSTTKERSHKSLFVFTIGGLEHRALQENYLHFIKTSFRKEYPIFTGQQ